MAVQLARLQGEPQQRQGPLYQPTPQPMAPQEKSAAQQMTDMAANKAMTATVDKGATLMNENVIAPAGEALTGMFSSAAPAATNATIGSTGLGSAAVLPEVAAAAAPTAAAGTGAMAALGTAVPYIGAAMLAGKAFGLFSEGGKVNPMYANMGGLMPMIFDKAKEEGIPMGLTSMLSKGGMAGPLYAADGFRGVEQQLETGKRQDMSKGPIGLLDMFVKGIDALTGYDRANEKRADLPEGKIDMLINKRRNPYTGEYPITEEEYQQVIDREPVNLRHGGMAGPLSKVEYKSAGGETYKLSYGGPISKGV